MSTVIRRKRVSHRELGPYRRHELLTGEIVYPAFGYSGYGDGKSKNLSDFIDDQMKADWDANRSELLWFWASGKSTVTSVFPDSKPYLIARGSPDTLPWAERFLKLLGREN